MRWLRRGVNDRRRLEFLDQPENACPIANIQLVMNESGKAARETVLVPASVSLRPEENLTLVIVNTVDLESASVEKSAHLRPDQARRSRYQTDFAHFSALAIDILRMTGTPEQTVNEGVARFDDHLPQKPGERAADSFAFTNDLARVARII